MPQEGSLLSRLSAVSTARTTGDPGKIPKTNGHRIRVSLSPIRMSSKCESLSLVGAIFQTIGYRKNVRLEGVHFELVQVRSRLHHLLWQQSFQLSLSVEDGAQSRSATSTRVQLLKNVFREYPGLVCSLQIVHKFVKSKRGEV